MKCSRSFRLLLLVCTLCFASTAGAVEWYKAYEKGRSKIRGGNCVEGVPLMQEALNQNPKPDLKAKTYGTFRIEYLPHFYLAQCAVESGDLASAQRYMREAESNQILASSEAKAFSELKSRIATMTPAPKQEAPAPEPPKPEVKPPQVVSNPPSNPVPAQSPEDTKKKEEEKRQASIRVFLSQAHSAITSGRYAEAKAAAGKVLSLDPGNDEAELVLSQVTSQELARSQEAEKQRKIQSIRNSIRQGDTAGAEMAVLELRVQYPSDSAVRALSEDLQRQRETASRQMQASEMKKMLERQVIGAYYRGQYEAVIQLSEQGLQNMSDNGRLYFFRGCSYAAISFLDPAKQDEYRNLARESFRKAKSVPKQEVVPPHISPKILEIYRAS